MNFLERLLDGVAVEWKPLGEVAEKIYSGGTPKTGMAEYWVDGSIPWMSSGEVNLETVYETEKFITEAGLKNSSAKFVPKNSLVIALAGQGKTRGKVARLRIDLTTNQSLASLTFDESKVNSDYVYHFLKTQYENLRQISSGGDTRGGLNLQMISNYKLPIPPLKVQAEIVRILDTFTELTAELTTELTAELIDRKKQYNYYRDRLLTFEKGEAEWKTLGEICSSISAGGDLPKNFAKGQVDPTDEFPYPIYANATGDNGLYGFTDGYKIESDAVTISARGAKIGYHAVREGKFTPIIRLITLVSNKNVVSTKYLNCILDMTPIGGTDGGIPQLTVPTVKKISIPLPPLAEQARIVALLDKFDTLTTSIREGLPREIALRQKQYEYYRDLLLTFPKPEEVEAHLNSMEKSHG